MEWFVAHWEWFAGPVGVGGLIASLRKVLPALRDLLHSLVRFLADAGKVPYLESQIKALRILLDVKSNDYDELLKDYQTLAKLRREQADSPD